ncbi:MAG: type I DNA topoisomerase [Planctomycetes bacterium]|nr:type I DNA topoisomerase [Planctomycetota bacterium]
MAKNSQHLARALVIVESPAKAKTINRYLGSDYTVMASMGHVRDLPPKEFGIDLDAGFEPSYEILGDKKRIVSGLKKAAASAEEVYLATDLDREGEAIAWHLAHALGLDEKSAKRVVFNEITKSSIQQAFASPLKLDMDKVYAQQARRLLDRIVGYQLSPLLQQKIAKGLSAGRVQSVAVRLIVERERDIRAFLPEESWRIAGCFAVELAKAKKHRASWQKFITGAKDPEAGRTVKERNTWLSKHACLYAEFVKLGGKSFKATKVAEARAVVEALGFIVEKVHEKDWEEYADKGLKKVSLVGTINPEKAPTFKVVDVQAKRTSTRPSPPFTTASLQQAASTHLGFAPSRTMRVAQQLYEGVNLEGSEGQVGLITYMRTDSVNLSKDSIAGVRKLIQKDFGESHLPAKPNSFAKAKRAQEAHEAIRPSNVVFKPDEIHDHLTAEQNKLYDLIWRRFVACQMTPAKWDNTTVLIGADTAMGEAIFRAGGRRLVFDGFLRVMGRSNTGDDLLLPEIEKDNEVAALDLHPSQQYTSPAARYSEAALVNKMEAEGIGRPSTYAAVIQTIQDRDYVKLIDKRMHPTERGEIVTDKLVEHFPKIMDIKFTSYMEEELDKIEEAHLDWKHVLGEFYEPFREALALAQNNMQRSRAEPSDFPCPDCGKMMVYRLGRNGKFLSCSDYPKCKVARNIDADGKPIDEVIADEPCAKCGKPMKLRKSRRGPFLGCTGYPECDNTLPADEEGNALRKVDPEEIDEKCPDCASAMTVKFGRGRAFLGCSAYPKCKATSPLPPGVYVEKPKPVEAGARCDKCGRPMVIRNGKRGPFLSCSGFPRCRNAMPMEKLDELRRLEEEGKIPDAPPEGATRNGKKRTVPKDKNGKIDYAAMGPPPPGFAWTRTGRPVIEVWPEEPLVCPDCGGDVASKTGRFGPYFGCTRYPKCSFVSNLRGEAKKRAEVEIPTPAKPKPIPTNVPCDECGESMVIRTGRNGQFLGCSKYPKCRHSTPMPEGETAETLAATAS